MKFPRVLNIVWLIKVFLSYQSLEVFVNGLVFTEMKIQNFPYLNAKSAITEEETIIKWTKFGTGGRTFREEFLKAKEKISGGVGLEQAENYEDWLGHKYIPHYGSVDKAVFLAFDSVGKLVGISDIRLGTNDFIQTFAGQIGYSVRPSQRKRGYASEILKLRCKAILYWPVFVVIPAKSISDASTTPFDKNTTDDHPLIIAAIVHKA